jgi:holo-[acyl-carrier protein] synthase
MLRAVLDAPGQLTVGLGVDLVDVPSFAHNHAVGGQRWLRKVFTESEIAHCGDDAAKLATRFAGKEAVVKALGTGFRAVRLRDVEIVTLPHGKPVVRLTGSAAVAAAALGANIVQISLTRDGDFALAVASANSSTPKACDLRSAS